MRQAPCLALSAASGIQPLLLQLTQQSQALQRLTCALSGLVGWRLLHHGKSRSPLDVQALPRHIVLIRHAESADLEQLQQELRVPNHRVPITERGVAQAAAAGQQLRALLLSAPDTAASAGASSGADGGASGDSGYASGSSSEPGGGDGSSSSSSSGLGGGGTAQPRVHLFTSPYLRCIQTAQHLVRALGPEHVVGVREEVQLREQDVGNFQNADWYNHAAERLAFSRFFFRWPNGESAADVYDRLTMLQDHLLRDLAAGRFRDASMLVLVTHGLTLRLFLMRWLRWTVDDFLGVHNVPEATPIVLQRSPPLVRHAPPPQQRQQQGPDGAAGEGAGAGPWFGGDMAVGSCDGSTMPGMPNMVKCMYRLAPESQAVLPGVGPGMCAFHGALSARRLARWRPYRRQVPPVAGCESAEAVLQALMAAGYGDLSDGDSSDADGGCGGGGGSSGSSGGGG